MSNFSEKSSADRTFEIVDAENIDPAPETENAELNRTYELDESQNPNLCPQIELKDEDCDKNYVPTLNSNRTISENDDLDNRPHLISILSDPLKDVSNLNESLAKTQITSDTHNSSAILAKASRKTSILKKGSLLDDTCTTIVTGRLQTPLLEKLRKSGPAQNSSNSNSSLDKTLTNENSVCGTAERLIKLSDTFITELLPENCLINSSPNELTHQRTPDVFRQKRNEIWHKNSPAKKSVGAPPQSKLPLLKKTPNAKLLPGKSPVADYIYRGISVQSASKNRHSYCLNDKHLLPKSEQKGGKSCKIPVATNAFAKRKLQMGEVRSNIVVDRKIDFCLHVFRPLFLRGHFCVTIFATLRFDDVIGSELAPFTGIWNNFISLAPL